MLREKRAAEEMAIRCEMHEVFTYYTRIHDQLNALLQDTGVIYSDGQRAMLLQKLLNIEKKCHELQTQFTKFINLPDFHCYFSIAVDCVADAEGDLSDSLDSDLDESD